MSEMSGPLTSSETVLAALASGDEEEIRRARRAHGEKLLRQFDAIRASPTATWITDRNPQTHDHRTAPVAVAVGVEEES